MSVLREGTQLKHGTFVILRELGAGGFGEVYLARQPRMQRDVAVKVLLPGVADHPENVARFQREALAAASVSHPNMLPVYDFDLDQESQVWFLAMRYVPGGETLKDRIQGTMDVMQCVRIISQLGGVLDEAHAHHIVHRDVKPANVLMDGDRPLLTDFGIAHLGSLSALTATGLAIGTPTYMSPEQAMGNPVGPKSDQYALAVLAYEMLAGRPPFTGDPLSLIHQHLNVPPPPLGSFNPSVPAAARAAIVLALSKNPDDRFGSCAEFGAALLAAVGDPTPPGPSAALAPQFSGQAAGPVQDLSRERPGPPASPLDYANPSPSPGWEATTSLSPEASSAAGPSQDLDTVRVTPEPHAQPRGRRVSRRALAIAAWMTGFVVLAGLGLYLIGANGGGRILEAANLRTAGGVATSTPTPADARSVPALREATGVRLTVLRAERQYTLASSAGPNLEWIVLRLRVENERAAEWRLASAASSLRLRDANGAVRDVDWARRGPGPAVPDPLPATNLLPGASAEGNVLFRWPVGGAPPVSAIWIVDRNPPSVVEASIP